ncbi:MAG: metallophosphoesterase family protein [Desulfamplus sp.]|nr:metallophosphoesterase family protein [Desulfamplus sp.]
MRYLLFSDIHCDRASCKSIIRKAENADIAIGAGDYALFRKDLKMSIDLLSEIEIPTVLVPGNHETLSELTYACNGLDNFHVLHGNSVEINGVIFMGIGYAIPITPFVPWSVDLSEEDARKFLSKPVLSKPDRGFVFIAHSPPFGCLDRIHGNQNIGSKTIRAFIEKSNPSFVVCGHIHEMWNRKSHIKSIPVINCGPQGYEFKNVINCN